MQHGQQEGEAETGTRDETYDVIAVVYHALQGAENCEIYAEDTEDEELRSFFQESQRSQQQLAEGGKRMLQKLLQKEAGQSGGSAFGFGQQGGSSSPSAEPSAAGGQTGGSGGSMA